MWAQCLVLVAVPWALVTGPTLLGTELDTLHALPSPSSLDVTLILTVCLSPDPNHICICVDWGGVCLCSGVLWQGVP